MKRTGMLGIRSAFAVIWSAVCIAFFVVIGCRSPGKAEQSSQKGVRGMVIIDVYRYERDPDNPKGFQEIYVGAVSVSSDGKLTIIEAIEGPFGEWLREAIEEISSHETLPARIERVREVDGKRAISMYEIQVKPGEGGYSLGVEMRLRLRWGFMTFTRRR